jgi:hypothetical protein
MFVDDQTGFTPFEFIGLFGGLVRSPLSLVQAVIAARKIGQEEDAMKSSILRIFTTFQPRVNSYLLSSVVFFFLFLCICFLFF